MSRLWFLLIVLLFLSPSVAAGGLDTNDGPPRCHVYEIHGTPKPSTYPVLGMVTVDPDCAESMIKHILGQTLGGS